MDFRDVGEWAENLFINANSWKDLSLNLKLGRKREIQQYKIKDAYLKSYFLHSLLCDPFYQLCFSFNNDLKIAFISWIDLQVVFFLQLT